MLDVASSSCGQGKFVASFNIEGDAEKDTHPDCLLVNMLVV